MIKNSKEYLNTIAPAQEAFATVTSQPRELRRQAIMDATKVCAAEVAVARKKYVAAVASGLQKRSAEAAIALEAVKIHVAKQRQELVRKAEATYETTIAPHRQKLQEAIDLVDSLLHNM